MARRYALFVLIVMLILAGDAYVRHYLGLNTPPPPTPNVAQNENDQPAGESTSAAVSGSSAGSASGEASTDVAGTETPGVSAAPAELAEAEAAAKAQWVTLGSLDQASPFRMLVTFSSAGAAVERIELNGPRFHELDDRSGYLGNVSGIAFEGGVLVQVVGAGTPAAAAGIRSGDIITAINAEGVSTPEGMHAILEKTSPGVEVEVLLRRDGQSTTVMVELQRHPLSIIRPEYETQTLRDTHNRSHNQLSLLVSLAQAGDQRISSDMLELPGVNLLDGHWHLETASTTDEAPADTVANEVVFYRTVPQYGVKLVKKYRLAEAPADQVDNDVYPAYHLLMNIEVHNLKAEPQQIAYQLFGPTGLPTEGWWYATRINAGLRDIVTQFPGVGVTSMTTQEVSKYSDGLKGIESSPQFIGVDAQYFAAVVIPQNQQGENWFRQWEPRLAGPKPAESNRARLADVTFRMVSHTVDLQPAGGEPLNHEFKVFAGPKRPKLLAHYGPPEAPLSEIVDYGWFSWVARPMLAILHFFYGIVGNYGIAIILLTVVVRGLLFPLSRKQVQSAQIMQLKMGEMAPEMKIINEKYKGNTEQRGRAMQALWKKHNYHPAAALGGCLLMFLQLPIFIGLYRSLMVDVELRQAPLISEAIRWCSNLSAPDMLFYWGSSPLPNFLVSETGWLGPFFNILPLITVALFLWQQKMFMPPPTDEQQALQQKIMQYMMIVIAFMFFKVASGLCIYFIASSLWGIAERKLLPVPTPKPAAPAGAVALKNGAANNEARKNAREAREKRPRGKK